MKLFQSTYFLAIIMLGLGTGAYFNNHIDLAVAFLLAGLINVAANLRLKKRST
ncbi:MAG: hypothetical protein KKB09_07105 [Nanoarchaeota archaeon]|nr:hypothetical protein [Nanoarchaeota archaeon]MBU4451723.1 hypothetical protein [Nanoarchaeota archaeon]